MSAYCLFDILEVTNPVAMDEYRTRVVPIIEKFGGRYVVAGGKFDVVEGPWRPTFPVIIQFPSLQHAHNWYNSADYRELKALRLSACRSHAVFMEGR